MKRVMTMLLLTAAVATHAEIPADYGPMVVQPGLGSAGEQVFDLSPALQQARREHKRLFVYLGAAECTACRRYTAFLETHEREMRPLLGRFVVVDLRASLRSGRRPLFVVDERQYSTAEFKARIGDSDPDLPYPTWWILTPAAKEVRQLPRGVNHFVDVRSHASWLTEH